MSTLHRLTTLACLLLTSAAHAEWQLDNDRSRLSFISIKAGDIGEVHRFTQLSGAVQDDGSVELAINLASVDTLIPIRDERMRDLLFEVVAFPTATLTASVDLAQITSLAPGATLATALEGTLTVHGRANSLTAQITVARLSPTEVMVAAAEPVIVTAAGVGLSEGVEKLREIAGLPSISQAVPVSFVLVFESD